jgi:hypothetical protein
MADMHAYIEGIGMAKARTAGRPNEVQLKV